MSGDRFQNLCRAHPQSAALVEKPDLDQCNRRDVAERPALVTRGEAAACRLSESCRFGQMPDKSVRVSDESYHVSVARQETRTSGIEPCENRSTSQPRCLERGPRAHAARADAEPSLVRRFPARSGARPAVRATGPPDAPALRRGSGDRTAAGWSGPHLSLYSNVIEPHHAVKAWRRRPATSYGSEAPPSLSIRRRMSRNCSIGSRRSSASITRSMSRATYS